MSILDGQRALMASFISLPSCRGGRLGEGGLLVTGHREGPPRATITLPPRAPPDPHRGSSSLTLTDLERLVAHKDVSVQSEAELPLLEEGGICLRVLAVCNRAGRAGAGGALCLRVLAVCNRAGRAISAQQGRGGISLRVLAVCGVGPQGRESELRTQPGGRPHLG